MCGLLTRFSPGTAEAFFNVLSCLQLDLDDASYSTSGFHPEEGEEILQAAAQSIHPMGVFCAVLPLQGSCFDIPPVVKAVVLLCS
jgi:hypothetical protein